MTVTARPTDLATALPGETSLDAALVAETVAAINATWRAGGLETARAVGALVVERFFGGDPANAHSRKRHHASFQAVAASPDLLLSASSLWYCVAVYEQYQQLPPEVADQLTVEHYRVLSHVADPAMRAALAEKTVSEGLTSKALALLTAETTAAPDDGVRRGRPPLPPVVKDLRHLSTAVGKLRTLDRTALRALDSQVRIETLVLARQLAADLGRWLIDLEEAELAADPADRDEPGD